MNYRFDISEIPKIILIKERHYYEFYGQKTATNLINFAKVDYKNFVANFIPLKKTFPEKLMKIIGAYKKLLDNFLLSVDKKFWIIALACLVCILLYFAFKRADGFNKSSEDLEKIKKD